IEPVEINRRFAGGICRRSASQRRRGLAASVDRSRAQRVAQKAEARPVARLQRLAPAGGIRYRASRISFVVVAAEIPAIRAVIPTVVPAVVTINSIDGINGPNVVDIIPDLSIVRGVLVRGIDEAQRFPDRTAFDLVGFGPQKRFVHFSHQLKPLSLYLLPSMWKMRVRFSTSARTGTAAVPAARNRKRRPIRRRASAARSAPVRLSGTSATTGTPRKCRISRSS